MKRRASLIIAGCLALSAAHHVRAAEPGSPEAAFALANQDYDAGRYDNALRGYRNLVDRGHARAEIFYNAGNAAFRGGQVGEAILYYRRAWYLAPRDPDIRANLQLALQRTGALQPADGLLDRAAQELSHREWTMLFEAAWWTLLAAGAAGLALPSLRRFARTLALAAGAVGLIAAGGWVYWYRWQQGGEGVVIADKQTALYEPREASTPFFGVPEGSVIVIDDTFDAWMKIRDGDKAGWVPRSAVSRVFPWDDGSAD